MARIIGSNFKAKKQFASKGKNAVIFFKTPIKIAKRLLAFHMSNSGKGTHRVFYELDGGWAITPYQLKKYYAKV